MSYNPGRDHRREHAAKYNEHHVIDTVLRRVEKHIDRHHATRDRLGLARDRFPDYEVSRPEAARLCAAMGIKKPRVGYVVDLVYDHNKDVTWTLNNKSGTFYLQPIHH